MAVTMIGAAPTTLDGNTLRIRCKRSFQAVFLIVDGVRRIRVGSDGTG